jgi:hypothetical protein
MTVIDIRSLITAVNGPELPELLGKIAAMLRAADELARHDKRWVTIAEEIAEVWCALMTKNVVKVRKHACKVLDEFDRLAAGKQ